MERLQYEFDAVGFFLSGHPLDAYAGVLAKLNTISFAELEARADRGVVAGRVAGVVVSARERRSQKGNKFAFAMFSEPTGQFEAVIFSETLAQSRHLLEPGTAVLISVEGERDGDTLKLRAQAIESLNAAAEGVQKGLKVVLDRRTIVASKAALARIEGAAEARWQRHNQPERDPRDDAAASLKSRCPAASTSRRSQKGALTTVPGVLEVIDV